MSDIDIEEHDVLQHPYIKEIFPDVSWIKTEIFHLDDNETPLYENVGSSHMILPSQSKEDVLESNDTSMSVNVKTTLLENEYLKEGNIKFEIEEQETLEEYSDSSNSNYNSVQYDSHTHSKNKIILGSNIQNTIIASLNVPENNILRRNFQNKIIVGSKPRLERDPLSAKVILKDWGYILKNHPYYCHECLILFPSQLGLDAHSESEHSLLVPKERTKVDIIDNGSQKDYTEEVVLGCPICGKFFKKHCLYLTHISNQHETLDLPPISEEFSGNCLLCPVRGLPNLSSLHHHINKFHAEACYRDFSVMEKPVSITIKSTARKSTINLQKTEKTSTSNSTRKSMAIGDDRVNVSRKSTSKQNIAIKNTSKQDVPTKNVALISTYKQNAPSRNRALKSTSKQVPLRNVARKSTTKEDVEQSILALKSTNSVVEPQTVSSKDRTKTNESFENTNVQHLICPVCGICFRYMRNYVNHCNANHKATYLPPKIQTFSGICECGYQNLIIKNFNAHVTNCHKPLATKIMTDVQEYFCIKCDISFATLTSYDIHNIVHKSDDDNMTDDRESKNHSFEELEVTQSSELIQSKEKDEAKKLVLIAKETIFKCPACNLHFMSCKTAFFHSVQCISSKPKVTCDECDRSLRFQDIQSHKLQHQLMSTINVIEMTREAFYNLVLVCFECKVGVDAYSIHVAHATECPTKESTVCEICNVKIANNCLNRHAKTHAKNIKPLIIEYLCGTVEDLKELLGIEKNVLYYCRVCKCYDPIKQADYHKYGNCIQNKMHICRMCGLGFSYDFHAKHILEHQNKSFKLIDIKFIDVQTDEVFKPLIPGWDKCVNGYRDKFSGDKRKHECYKETTVYCNKCQENYNDLAYKIHLQYHEHSVANIDSEIMQKYLTMQSLWNIVYLCRNCNTTFDSYDLAVEHSQDHLSHNVQNPSVKCTKCDLNFDDMSYARHANLHNGAAINKESFCVLSFQSENLLTKSWDDVLKVVSCEQKSHILSKSVYTTHREIRLELHFDGPPTHTLYKCAVCEAIVDDSRLLKHAYNKNACANEKLSKCSQCDLKFEKRVSLNEHRLNHPPANEIRIILFNKPNHFSLNEALIKKFRNSEVSKDCKIIKEESKLLNVVFYKCILCKAGIQTLINIQKHKCSSLKYVKCKKCKLLYRPSTINAHMTLHESVDKFHVAPFENGKLIAENRSKIYTLYKCKKCNICTSKKLPKHICVPKRAQSACNSCGLQFMKSKYGCHVSMHKKNSNLSRQHFNIIRYKPISDKADKTPIIPSKKISYKLMPTKHISYKPVLNTDKMYLLYKCTCSLLFVTWRKLKLHLKSCKPNFIGAKCKCGLSFHRSSLKDHHTVHPNCMSIKNYLVASVDFYKGKTDKTRKHWVWICTVCYTYYNNIKNVNCHLRGNKPGPIQNCRYCSIKISAESFDDHMELHKKNNYGPLQLHKLYLSMIDVVPLKKRRQQMKEKPKLYKCQDCDVHFTNRISLDSHLSEINHDAQKTQCKFCNYFFLSTIIHYHIKNHHYRNKYKREDFIIINTVKNIETEKPAKPTAIIVDPSSQQTVMTPAFPKSIRKTIEKSLSEKSEADLKRLFQCGICKLNFMVLRTLRSHIIRHSENVKKSRKKYNCSFCGLEFQTRSLARHVFVHHKILKLQLQDLIIAIYSDINKYTIKRIKVVTQTNKRIIQSDKVKPDKKHKSTLKVNPGSFKKTKKSLSSKPHFETPQRSPKIQPNSKPNYTPIPTSSSVIQSESSPQLFKCAYCDVYFTNYVLCYDHSLNHRPLDPTEYIGCKVCDLQFVCECLGIHMKGHREGTFNIEDLVVKEFQPRDGTPSIKTYLARNLIETNKISTFFGR